MGKLNQVLQEVFDQSGLPGWQAQRRMSVQHDEHLRLNAPSHARDASVLALIQDTTDPGIFLIERQHHKDDRHSGQLSFPGGKVEPEDNSLLHTALREANEEIGLNIDHIDILGELTNLYIPVSNFLVHPFVAYTDKDLHLVPEKSEVADIVKLNLDVLLNPLPNKTDITIHNGLKLSNVPYYPLDSRIVWGATAMILAELGHILESNSKFVNIVDPNSI